MKPQKIKSTARRSMLLRHQLAEEVRKMEGSSTPFAVSLSSVSDDFENELDHLVKQTPNQPVAIQPLRRIEKSEFNQIYRERNRLRYKYKVPFFYTAFKITQSPIVSYFITVLLFINVFTSVYLCSANEEEHRLLFQIFRNYEFVATAFYFVEITLKILAHRRNFWTNVWNVFDFILFVISICPPGFVILVCTQLNFDIMHLGEKIKIIYILNASRIFRLVPRISSLQKITEALASAAKSMLFVSILIVLIMCIFAIIGQWLFYEYTISDNEDYEYRYKFRSFGKSMVTVFQLMTFDSWLSIFSEVSAVVGKPLTLIFFLSWLWVGAFVFANIFVGVMVDQFKDNAENAKQQQENEEIAKLAIKTQGKYDKFGGERHKFNAQMQLLGREISQKVTQIYSHFEQFENDDKTVGNNESSKHELQRLLKHMGQDFETEWTNEDLCNYLNSLRLICDELIEMEHLEKETSKAIQSYLEPK